jgi:GntR family transcriptional regulator
VAQSRLDKINGIPLYVQIRESIRERVKEGEFEVGSLLPSEEALAKDYGVSRMTLRHALDDLLTDGIIIRKHGIGTIISSSKVVRDYSQLTSFYEDAKKRGLKPRSEVSSIEKIAANKLVASDLMIKEGDQVFHFFRKRLVEDNQVVALHELFIPVQLCPWIEEVRLEGESLYDLYDRHGLSIEWGKQLVEAHNASAAIARELEIETGAAILYSERISFTNNNLPVERVIAVSPGDRFSLNLVMRR